MSETRLMFKHLEGDWARPHGALDKADQLVLYVDATKIRESSRHGQNSY